ncbi:MAG TPA: HD domain-containing phosphohydrolase [Candidatus Eremiobacteraceae bacterium]|nr:HD domain-containing phosphohydrolase [Candidatus Eremiobacteraceae bacterium]
MNVLIVDDSQPNLIIYKGIVRNLGGSTAVCFSVSAEALTWCKTNDPDVVVVDYNMPSPDGLEFIRTFRLLPRKSETPILMITAETDKHLRYKALETGASDFLTKPVDVIEFTARARNMLELRRSRKELEDRASWLAVEVEKATAQIVARERETIWRLARVAEFRDTGTGMHVVRMAQYCKAIGRALGMTEDEREILLMAAPMHDIGKIAIPDSILLKPGKLTDVEFATMKQHTVIGFEILKNSSSHLLRTAAEIAISHHERFDGSGYPHGKKGDAIPLEGRICALSDVFDALTSVRPYKQAWAVDAAVAEVERGIGSQFDPKVVAAFVSVLPEVDQLRREYSDEAQRARTAGIGTLVQGRHTG